MTYPQLLATLDEWFRDGVAQAGAGVVLCRRGCSECCYGPFDISAADAEMVVGAVSQLPTAVRSDVAARARQQVARYELVAPDWHRPWDIDAISSHEFDEISDTWYDDRCPALGDDGACLVYHSRPANCRLIGLPLLAREGGVLENACPIIDTSAAYAALAPTFFDLQAFEGAADLHDRDARDHGFVATTVAGAIAANIA